MWSNSSTEWHSWSCKQSSSWTWSHFQGLLHETNMPYRAPPTFDTSATGRPAFGQCDSPRVCTRFSDGSGVWGHRTRARKLKMFSIRSEEQTSLAMLPLCHLAEVYWVASKPVCSAMFPQKCHETHRNMVNRRHQTLAHGTKQRRNGTRSRAGYLFCPTLWKPTSVCVKACTVHTCRVHTLRQKESVHPSSLLCEMCDCTGWSFKCYMETLQESQNLTR